MVYNSSVTVESPHNSNDVTKTLIIEQQPRMNIVSIQNIPSPPDNHRNTSIFDNLGSSLVTNNSKNVQQIRLLEHKVDCLQFEVKRARDENEKLKSV